MAVVAIQPKQKTVLYKQHKINVVFNPTTKKWQWSFTYQAPVMIPGEADDMNKAISDAKVRIDTLQARNAP